MGIPGAANPLLLRRAAAAADDAYQIEKSLRFNDGDSAFLNRSPSSDGDRRTWTLSMWVKDCTPSANTALFGDDGGSPNIYCYLMNNYQLRFAAADGSGGDAFSVDSVRLFRDPGAFYSFVFVVDTSRADSSERIKVFCNGERIALTNTTYPDQNEEITAWNSDGAKERIGQFSGGSYFDGYIADVQFISGLALSPAAFGSFDSTGTFNPAAFSIPNPNDGTTWSSSGTVSGNATEDVKKFANLFDGALDTWSEQSGNDVTLTWTPGTPIPIKSSLRIYFAVGGDPEDTVINEKVMVNPAAGWVDVDIAGETTFSKLEMKRGGSGVYARASAIEIDGVILIDGKTDPTTRSNPNTGTVYSDGFSGTVWSSDYAYTKAFDGALNTGTHASAGNTVTWTGSVAADTVELYITKSGSPGNILVNGTNVHSQVTSNVWSEITGITWPLTSIALPTTDASNYNWLKAVRVNGHVLIDSTVDNSFHLKFNDTSSNARIGRNSFNKGIEDSSVNGALPIYNTTAESDGYDQGQTKGSGYRTDSSAGTTNDTGLVLAIPGDSVASGTCDVHQQVNTGSSNKAINSNNGSVVVKTDQSRFYGSSLYFDDSDDYINFADDADWDIGTGDYTIETWVRWETIQNDETIIGCYAGNYAWQVFTGGGGSGKFTGFQIRQTDNTYKEVYANRECDAGIWYHLAVVVHGDTLKLFLNGTLENTTAFDGTVKECDQVVQIGSRVGGTSNKFNGWINDLRIYKGVAKYTSTFTPPTRNDFTVNNLSEAGFGSTTKRAEVVQWTGNGANNRAITGVGFQPDFVLVKRTDATNNWRLSDVMRGSGGDTVLRTDDNGAEVQDGNIVKSFDADGFTVGTESHYNGNGNEIMALCLKAGGAGSSNSDGSITSSVSVNSDQSFSMVTYTGTGSNATVGHGLGKAPKMIIVKKRNAAENWGIYHVDAGAGNRMALNDESGPQSTSTWNSTDPTDDVFSIGVASLSNTSGHTYVAYCFADSAGICDVGSYTGNGSTSGPSVDCGFKPKFLLGKKNGSAHWFLLDSVRGTNYRNWPDITDAHSSVSPAYVSFTSSGFTVTSSNDEVNASSAGYFYLAFGDGTVDNSGLDVFNDTPTNYEDSSGDVHGNFCTMNPLSSNSGITLSQGNLRITGTGSAYGTFLMPRSGKYYWEVTANSAAYIGIDNRACGGSDYVHYNPNGQKQVAGGSTSSYGSSFTTGDVIGVAVDMTSQSITFYKNNTSQGAIAFSSVSLTDKDIVPLVYSDNSAEIFTEFGSGTFKYTPPTGFKSLCTQNLDDFSSGASVNNPSKYFDVLTWTGVGSNDTDRTGLAFQPDLVWIKKRSGSTEGTIVDAARGVTKSLNPSYNTAEYTASSPHHEVQAFLSNGVTIGQNGRVNTSGDTYVGWFWDAGTAAATASTAGSITPSAQWVNATAGFSMSKYTGTGSAATIGTGLSTAADLYIVKKTNDTGHWNVASIALGIGYDGVILNLTSDKGSISTNYWNNTAPTSTVVSIGTADNVNESGDTFIMYCWTSIPGFSHFGTYEGNGDANGPFIYTGFRPRWILFKNADITKNWSILDTARDDHNVADTVLKPDSDDAESTSADWSADILSNGFKPRDSGNAINGNGNTIIYAAFASSPFKTARAR